MKKHLIAAAVAAAVATSASAQVTMSGYIGGSADNFSISRANAARTGNTSENRVSDQSSRILFNVKEDLGGGLSAVGQYDLRFKVDAAARVQSESNATAGNPAVDAVTNGNIHVGLSSTSMGTLKFGRQDIHYTEQASLLPGGLYLAAVQAPVIYGANALSIANFSRTPNLIWYVSPRISGLEASVGYSTNPIRASATNEVENDLGTSDARRKGSGTWGKLNYATGPLDLTYSYYSAKSDYSGGTGYLVAGAAASGAGGAAVNAQYDQLSQTLLGKYQITNDLRAAVGFTRNEWTSVGSVGLLDTAQAFNPALSRGDKISTNAKHASISYQMGASNITANLAKRENLTQGGTETNNSGLTQYTIAYTYDLSKRTAVGLMHSQLLSGNNTVNPGMFYQGNNAYGGQIATMRGETYRLYSAALRHNF